MANNKRTIRTTLCNVCHLTAHDELTAFDVEVLRIAGKMGELVTASCGTKEGVLRH